MKVRVLGCSGAIAKDCRTTSFLIGDLADQFGGWLLAGFGMAAMLKPRRIRSF